MEPYSFPMPFGGITQARPLTPAELSKVLVYVVTQRCGDRHVHNFAIELDYHYKGNLLHQIYGSPLLMDCVDKALED